MQCFIKCFNTRLLKQKPGLSTQFRENLLSPSNCGQFVQSHSFLFRWSQLSQMGFFFKYVLWLDALYTYACWHLWITNVNMASHEHRLKTIFLILVFCVTQVEVKLPILTFLKKDSTVINYVLTEFTWRLTSSSKIHIYLRCAIFGDMFPTRYCAPGPNFLDLLK